MQVYRYTVLGVVLCGVNVATGRKESKKLRVVLMAAVKKSNSTGPGKHAPALGEKCGYYVANPTTHRTAFCTHTHMEMKKELAALGCGSSSGACWVCTYVPVG